MYVVQNNTSGPLFIDVPSEEQKTGDDILGKLLSGAQVIDSLESAVRALLSVQLQEKLENLAAQQLAQAALARAKNTVDLWPVYQGEDSPPKYNYVPDEIWERAIKVPAIAARISAGQITYKKRSTMPM